MSTGNQLRAFLLVVQEMEEEVEKEGASNAMLPPIAERHQQPVVAMAVIMKATVVDWLQLTGLKEEVGL